MDSKISDFSGIPLTSAIARPIIIALFKETPQWTRQELASAVERMHMDRGGVRGTQPPVAVVKKVLTGLAEEGAVKSVSSGIWRRVSTDDASPRIADPSTESVSPTILSAAIEEDEELPIREEIGKGPEAVYLYYNPNDRELAELRGRDTWECKIGHTLGDVDFRIAGQGARTALSHPPVIGLVIRTDNAVLLERALHGSLRLADREVVDSIGNEWFFTSPDRVKQWYAAYIDSLKQLCE
jgi:hypothetical protein